MRYWVVAAAVLLLAGASAGDGSRGKSTLPATARVASPNAIVVLVRDGSSRHGIPDARVFVLSESGKELASTSTDSAGRATLPPLSSEQSPKYVLVEHPHYFISGLTWINGMREYYIVTTILTVR
jgi:hypothetical protein